MSFENLKKKNSENKNSRGLRFNTLNVMYKCTKPCTKATRVDLPSFPPPPSPAMALLFCRRRKVFRGKKSLPPSALAAGVKQNYVASLYRNTRLLFTELPVKRRL